MTERKPAGISFESWVDRQIREATERGEFDNLPGAGKPLPGAGQPYREDWWLADKLRRENVTNLPPTLALRRRAQDARSAARAAGSEAEVRRIIAEINEHILAAIRVPPAGPPLNLTPYDVDQVLADWRRDQRRD